MTGIEKLVEDRISQRTSGEESEAAYHAEAGTKEPVNGFFLMIKVHEDVGNQRSLERRNRKTENTVHSVETMLADIQPRDRSDRHRDQGSGE